MLLDTSIQALLQILTSPEMLVLMLTGVLVGTFFGIMPGLGGKLGLVFLIPFTIGMDPLAGAVFLVAMHSVVHTSGAIPSIIFGIPGTGPDAATIIDGYPMAQKGEAGRALGATLFASGVGGLIGAIFLSALLPFIGPIVLAFIVYHLLHFTFCIVQPEYFQQPDAKGRPDAYSMFVMGFESRPILISYLVAVALLCLHLTHGASSWLQSLGLKHPKYDRALERLGPVLAVILIVGYFAPPLAVAFHVIEL